MRILRKPLSLVLALACVGLTAPAFANDGKGNLRQAPADAFGIVHFNVARMRTSPLVQEFIKAAEESPDGKEAMAVMKDKIGMNPKDDLNGITVMVPQDVPTGGKPFVILNGKYDVAKAKAAAKGEGGLTEKGNLMVGPDGMALAFENGRIVAGPEASVTAALGGKGGNKALEALAGAADAGKDMWFAASVPPAMAGMLTAADPLAADIKAATGSLDLAGGALALKVAISTGKPESAAQLAEKANAMLKEAGAQALGQIGLGNVAKNINIAANGAVLNVTIALTVAEVNVVKAIALAGMSGPPRTAPKGTRPVGTGSRNEPATKATPAAKGGTTKAVKPARKGGATNGSVRKGPVGTGSRNR